MEPSKPWYVRAKDGLLRFWRATDPRLGAVRDVLVAVVVVLGLLGVVWVYTGQDFPNDMPLVVVESGSMMHGPDGPCLDGRSDCADFASPPFSRIGTIDPGDIVVVKKVDGYGDVETAFGSGGRGGYGGHGDVLVYERDAVGEDTPVIHRAMLLILVSPEGCRPNDPLQPCTYRIPETCNADLFAGFVRSSGPGDWRDYCRGSTRPITLRLERDGLFLDLERYPCDAQCPPILSGFVTKGDNNFDEDQPWPYTGQATARDITCCPVRIDQVVGKARGEVPWFGLLKLALYGNPLYEPRTDPTGSTQWSFLRATAPWDVWFGLVAAVGLLIVVPLGIDWTITRVRSARRERRGRGPPPAPRPPPPPPEGGAPEASTALPRRTQPRRVVVVRRPPRKSK